MIKIKINYDGNYVTGFKITGHANYDEYGKDIVCASASSIAITSVNMVLKLDENSIKVTQRKGLIDVTVIKRDDIINKVLINMIEMLKELEAEYKKNVKII